MQSSFHHSNIPTSSMPIAQQTFFPSNSGNFVYQPLLPINVGRLNRPTVIFPLTLIMSHSHRMFNHSLAEEQLFMSVILML